MGTPFSPTRQDVERYLRLRALSRELGARMIKTIPRQAYQEIGAAIGILRNGVLVFDSEDMTGVMADCCLYDWFENGKNLVQRYAETHLAEPGTDGGYLLTAWSQAKYRVLAVQSAVPDAGIHCRDVLNGEELFVMDLALSRSFQHHGAALATRTIPLGEFWMTGGAGLPINADTIERMKFSEHESVEGLGGVALMIVRSCLAAGAAEYIRYEGPGENPKKLRREPRWPGFKRRRRQI